jgi:hypothetical protein
MKTTNLIAGNHRLAAAKECGWETIRAIVFTHDELINQLQEIDENLFVNSLCYISQSENIAKREEILGVLGKRTKRGHSVVDGVSLLMSLQKNLVSLIGCIGCVVKYPTLSLKQEKH